MTALCEVNDIFADSICFQKQQCLMFIVTTKGWDVERLWLMLTPEDTKATAKSCVPRLEGGKRKGLKCKVALAGRNGRDR